MRRVVEVRDRGERRTQRRAGGGEGADPVGVDGDVEVDPPRTGATQAFPPPVTLAAALRRGVGLEAMTNAAAARTYSVLAGEGRRVVAAFLLQD